MQSSLVNPSASFDSRDSHASAGTVPSKKRVWAGRLLSGLPAAFLFFDAIGKLLMMEPVLKACDELGYPVSTILPMGIALFVSTLLYVIPRTAFFGALLLTAYLGGAVATHVRVEHPLFSHTLFPIYFAIMIWAGLTLRDRRLEALVRGRPTH